MIIHRMQILITYATNTGNTETVAETLSDYIKTTFPDHEITLTDMDELHPSDFLNYDLIFIGSSTWGEGEFNEIAEEFFEKLNNEDINLSKIRFAIFGLGDSFYKNFCTVVELMSEQLAHKKANLHSTTYKLDGFPDDDSDNRLKEWAESILKD